MIVNGINTQIAIGQPYEQQQSFDRQALSHVVVSDKQVKVYPIELDKPNNDSTIHEKLKQINKVLDDLNKGVQFEIVDKQGYSVVQLVEIADKKVIYQMPAEGILQAAAKLNETIGLIIDHKK